MERRVQRSNLISHSHGTRRDGRTGAPTWKISSSFMLEPRAAMITMAERPVLVAGQLESRRGRVDGELLEADIVGDKRVGSSLNLQIP